MRKAFTLIELLVALSLIALLVSLVGPSGKRMYEKFSKRVDKIKQNALKNDKDFQKFLDDNLTFDKNKS